MDVVDIQLRQRWLYDHEVEHCGRENTYKFQHKNKIILLHLAYLFVNIKPMKSHPSGLAKRCMLSLSFDLTIVKFFEPQE